MNLVRKIKIHKITNQPLTEVEQEIYDFVYGKLKDLKPFTSDSYSESIFYGSDIDSIILEQDNKKDRLWVKYTDFWKVLEDTYSMKKSDIQDLISYMVLKTLKFKPSTPNFVVCSFCRC